jgi:hypothetical protein
MQDWATVLMHEVENLEPAWLCRWVFCWQSLGKLLGAAWLAAPVLAP